MTTTFTGDEVTPTVKMHCLGLTPQLFSGRGRKTNKMNESLLSGPLGVSDISQGQRGCSQESRTAAVCLC